MKSHTHDVGQGGAGVQVAFVSHREAREANMTLADARGVCSEVYLALWRIVV